MTKLERLQKEINGKVIIYKQDRLEMECLLLWPPGGGKISFKPFGYSPEEILKCLKRSGFNGYTIKETSSNEFCCATVGTSGAHFDVIAPHLSTMGECDIYDALFWDEKTNKVEAKDEIQDLFSPSCPY